MQTSNEMVDPSREHKTRPIEIPEGFVPMRFYFYVFAQRAAWGLATESECKAMERIFDIANTFEAWDLCVNDIMT